jgi:hypothetical protein
VTGTGSGGTFQSSLPPTGMSFSPQTSSRGSVLVREHPLMDEIPVEDRGSGLCCHLEQQRCPRRALPAMSDPALHKVTSGRAAWWSRTQRSVARWIRPSERADMIGSTDASGRMGWTDVLF